MKCPKCGYVSFNYLDQCKKCSKDLVLFKEEMHIWGIKPGTIAIYPMASEDSPFDSAGLSAEEGIEPAIETATDEPSPILEESDQEIASQVEAIETPPEEPIEATINLGEKTSLSAEDEDEIVLEEDTSEIDIPFPSIKEEDKDLQSFAAGISAESEDESGPAQLLDEMEQDIQLDLEGEEETLVLPIEESDEASEEPIILLEEEDQSEEEEIILHLEDSPDDLELSIGEDEEEEIK
jgi:hypothetical protein